MDVSSGLAEALKEGIIHNDIKDPNILVFNSEGKKVYKITNFESKFNSQISIKIQN